MFIIFCTKIIKFRLWLSFTWFYMILMSCAAMSQIPIIIRPFLVKNSLSTKGNTGNTSISDTAKWVEVKMGVPQIIQVMRNHGSVFNTAMVTWEYEIPHVRNPTYVVVFQCISYSQSPWLLGFPTIVTIKVAFSQWKKWEILMPCRELLRLGQRLRSWQCLGFWGEHLREIHGFSMIFPWNIV